MSSLKTKHYWAQLFGALVAGDWSAQLPARTPNGTVLSWSELFRKFNKHCPGHPEVTQIASHTQTLGLLLETRASKDGLSLADTCQLPAEAKDDIKKAYGLLKELNNTDNVKLILGYHAYAIGIPNECVEHIDKVSDVCNFESRIPASRSGSLLDGASTSSFVSSDTTSLLSQTTDGRAWAMTEAIRSISLRGMSYEQLSPSDPSVALLHYRAAFPLLSDLASYTPISGSFVRCRELWRWVILLLWRAIVLSAQTSNVRDPNDPIWTWISHYSACSTHWPPKFNTERRSTILVLALRAFVLRGSSKSIASPPWQAIARTLIHEYRAILNASTSFPRAGSRNVSVEDFTDLAVAVWESGDQTATWILDILWWATRLTFNSHRVLRHMTRVLHASGDIPLATRVARLYVQVGGKAWEAASGSGETKVGPEMDSDQRWVETLVAGARMLCAAATPISGLPEVREAGEWIAKAKPRLDNDNLELVASVALAEGIWSAVLALTEQDSQTRADRFAHSHELLLRAVETLPSASAHYHLALSFVRAGPAQDLQLAIQQVGLAIEAEPNEIRSWHLLGLLLATMEKWDEAIEALEQGALIGEDAESELPLTNGNGDGLKVEGVDAKDFAVNGDQIDGLPRTTSEDDRVASLQNALRALHPGAVEIPPSEDLLRPVRDHPNWNREELFEHALQLRMTEVAVIEYVEGAEGASDKWVEVFAWIAEKKGKVNDQPRSSLDGARSTKPSSSGHAPSLSQVQEDEGQDILVPEPSDQDHSSSTIPIMISPATPDTEKFDPRPSKEFSIGGSSKSKKVQQMLKNQVHKSGATISTFSKKLGNNVVRNGSLRRSNSTPDLHSVLVPRSYQASSIHSRRRVTSMMRSPDTSFTASPPPPPLLPATQQKLNRRVAKENRLYSDLWLMSSATFRRLGKIEQAKGAIQEAEVKDESNPGVWVQLGLYYAALGQDQQAIDSFQKALFIVPDDVSATVHLCRLYLAAAAATDTQASDTATTTATTTTPLSDPGNVDLAAGMLAQLTHGSGWDVPEAWYYLAKAYAMQGRSARQRECLDQALTLAERRGVREIGSAVGWCL